MTTGNSSEETKVSDRGMVTIPAEVRRRLDIEPGDKLEWTVKDDGQLAVEVVRQRYGAFDGAPTADLGEEDESHDVAGYEAEFPEET